ncbi:Ig-like domain-containing protein, partial [Bacillus thuringiensis]
MAKRIKKMVGVTLTGVLTATGIAFPFSTAFAATDLPTSITDADKYGIIQYSDNKEKVEFSNPNYIDSVQSIAKLKDNRYVAVGYTNQNATTGMFSSFGNNFMDTTNQDQALIRLYDENMNLNRGITIQIPTDANTQSIVLRKVIATSDGGFLTVGSTSFKNATGTINNSGTNNKALMAKFDKDGKFEWQKTYGGSGFDLFSSVIETNDGYVAVGGSSSRDGDLANTGNRVWGGTIVKFSKGDTAEDIEIKWQKKHTTNNTGNVYNADFYKISDITLTPDGHLAVVGQIPGSWASTFFQLLDESTGDKLYEDNLDGAYTDLFNKVLADKDGNIYAFGFTESQNNNFADPLLKSKINNGANLLMVKYGKNSKGTRDIIERKDIKVYGSGDTKNLTNDPLKQSLITDAKLLDNGEIAVTGYEAFINNSGAFHGFVAIFDSSTLEVKQKNNLFNGDPTNKAKQTSIFPREIEILGNGQVIVAGEKETQLNYSYSVDTHHTSGGHNLNAAMLKYRDGFIGKWDMKLTDSPVDDVFPAAPEVNEVTDVDTQVTGKAKAGSTVSVKVEDNEIGQGQADENGMYTITIPKQTAGTKLSVTASNSAGTSQATEVTV